MPTAETSSYAGPNWARTQDDYHLISGAGERAKAAGLVNASWYKCAVPRARMKQLMQREDAQAIRDTVLWYALIIAAGAVLVATWGTAWAWLAFFVYATLYTGPADSRWHEAGHGTAFKTRWMNDVLYQMACFQVLRRPSVWKWSHARHHTDTLVTGRDPEVAVPLPTARTRVTSAPAASLTTQLTSAVNEVGGQVTHEDELESVLICGVNTSDTPAASLVLASPAVRSTTTSRYTARNASRIDFSRSRYG